MTNVKICGLKREEDILYVNELKPDYVGFVFAKSSRQIDMHKGKKLTDILDKDIKRVGVFLNHSADEVNEIAAYCQLDILQFHGQESPLYCKSFNYQIWKAFRIKDEKSVQELEAYNVDGFLLDTFVKGHYGGTGKVFNWSMVSNVNKSKFTILAGGLQSENIKKAIERVKPQVVDLSSGVEVNGVKNFEKIRKIIEIVRG